MITTELKDKIIEKVEVGGVSPDGKLETDSVVVFVVGSKSHAERPQGLMPAGNFEHKDVQYAVYFT